MEGGQPPAPAGYPHQIANNVLPWSRPRRQRLLDRGERAACSRRTRCRPRRRRRLDDLRARARPGGSLRRRRSCRIRAPLAHRRCRELLAAAPGVVVVDDPASATCTRPRSRRPGPTTCWSAGSAATPGTSDACTSGSSADNLRKGAATNAVAGRRAAERSGPVAKRAGRLGGAGRRPHVVGSDPAPRERPGRISGPLPLRAPSGRPCGRPAVRARHPAKRRRRAPALTPGWSWAARIRRTATASALERKGSAAVPAVIDGDCGNGPALGLGDQHEAGERLDRIELGEQLDGVLGRAGLPDSQGGGGHVDQFDVQEAEVPLNLLPGRRKVCLRMLDVRKLRVLREVETRGTIAAAADALRYTPSARLPTARRASGRGRGGSLLERVGRSVPADQTPAGASSATPTGFLCPAGGGGGRARPPLTPCAGPCGCPPCQTVALAACCTRAIAELGARQSPISGSSTRRRRPRSQLPLLAGGGLDLVIAEEYDYLPRPPGPAPRPRRAGARPDPGGAPRGPPNGQAGPPRSTRGAGRRALGYGAQRRPLCGHDRLRAPVAVRASSPTSGVARTTSWFLFRARCGPGHAVALAPGLRATRGRSAGVTAPARRPDSRLGRTIFTAVPALERPPARGRGPVGRRSGTGATRLDQRLARGLTSGARQDLSLLPKRGQRSRLHLLHLEDDLAKEARAKVVR